MLPEPRKCSQLKVIRSVIKLPVWACEALGSQAPHSTHSLLAPSVCPTRRTASIPDVQSPRDLGLRREAQKCFTGFGDGSDLAVWREGGFRKDL